MKEFKSNMQHLWLFHRKTVLVVGVLFVIAVVL